MLGCAYTLAGDNTNCPCWKDPAEEEKRKTKERSEERSEETSERNTEERIKKGTDEIRTGSVLG